MDRSEAEGNVSEVPTDCKSLLDKLLDKLDDSNHRDEDDLEEGELEDDDDDDDDDDNEKENGSEKDKDVYTNPAKTKESSSDDDSPVRTASSSSSSSSSSSDSKEHSSSKSSSKIGSHHSSSSRNNNASSDRYGKLHLSSSRHLSEDRYRSGRDREREDPSEKAAKLISMRTKLLEARSREIELKFQKNKGLISQHQPPPPLINLGPQRNIKMTITKPSISYNENPNPTYVAPTPVVEVKKKIKSKPKSEEKEKKSKKTSKRRKKSTSKKHRKHKSTSAVKKSSLDSKPSGPPEPELPYDNNQDRQGPRTPPDNHVLTLEDEQIEWPSHLIRMTTTQPSISYSVNPGSMGDMSNEGRKDEYISTKRKSTSITNKDRKKYKSDEKHSSISSSSPSVRTVSPRNTEENSQHRKYLSRKQTSIYETDLNSDHTWYYNYFMDSYEMDHHQAQHQAYTAIISAGNYENVTFEKWLKSKGLIKLSSTGSEAQKQLYPFSLKEEIPSPPGSPQSTSTKPDLASTSESVDQLTGASIGKVITRLTRNQLNRDINEHLNHKSEVSHNDKDIKVSVTEVTQHAVETETNREQVLKNEELETDTGCEASQQIRAKTEETIGQPSVSTTLTEDGVSICPVKPKFTIIKSQREIVLPNGHVLPAGTIQKIVHPYPRIDSEVMGPYFDLF